MHAIAPADWTPRQTELWRRIEAHAFEHPDQALDFTRRLARDRDWSLAFARGAVAAYRRFCFLAMIGATPMTPSEEVDEVWHQHLTYTRDYWDLWCAQRLGAALHHDPTSGGSLEAVRYRAQYAETLAQYEAFFGAPDPDYWPSTQRRFRTRPRYRMVDRDRTLVLPRPAWWGARLGGAFGVLALAAGLLHPSPALALPLNPIDWPAAPFLTLYGLLVALAVTVVAVTRLRLLAPDAGGEAGGHPGPWGWANAADLDLLHLAWLGGGRGRASDLVLAGLVEAGAARIAPDGRSRSGTWGAEIEIDDRVAAVPEPFAAFRGRVHGDLTHAAFTRAVTPALDPVEEDLVRRALLPPRWRIARARVLILSVVGAVAGFGAVKVAVGALRDKPVGYLLVLIFGIVVVAAVATAQTPVRTRLGKAVLASYRDRYRRAASAPRAQELLFAFALGGATVLAGTHLADLGRLIRAQGGGGGDGGSGGDGSGSGGGCGGCGGCGGGGGD